VQRRFSGLARLASALIAVASCAACGATRPPRGPSAPVPAPALIALLPDPETQVTGRIVVSNEFGAVNVSTPRASVRAVAGAPLGAITTLSEAQVHDLFGDVLAALPPSPKHFILQFTFESDQLTDASAALVPTILDAVKSLATPELAIIGHTDTMGDRKANVALGLKRAMAVRDILVRAGLSPALITVSSHGEGDLLIKTRDNTPEPRNRRVEITVR